MIDTHCHIYSSKFENDLADVLDRAAEAGVTEIYMPAIDFDSLPKMDAITHPDIRFYRMAGVHPVDVKSHRPELHDQLLAEAEKPETVGIGETGLDYYWSKDFIAEQKESLHIHCKIAKQTQKPIILHNRNSTEDLLDLIESEQDGTLTGIWHCFTGNYEEGKRAIDMGLHLGLGGVLTFKNSGVAEAVAQLPIEKLVLETDAPYLAPHPNRGKRNEPSFMNFTALKLANVFGIDKEDVVAITSANAKRIFGT